MSTLQEDMREGIGKMTELNETVEGEVVRIRAANAEGLAAMQAAGALVGQEIRQQFQDAVTADVDIYVDGSLSAEGDGTSSAPYNNLWVAIMSVLDGVSTSINIKGGQEYILSGEGSYKLLEDMDIRFYKWGDADDPLIVVDYFKDSAGFNRPGVRFIAHRKLRIQFHSGVNTHFRVLDNSGMEYRANMFIDNAATCVVDVSFWSNDLKVDPGVIVMSPYVKSSRHHVMVNYCDTHGGGLLVGNHPSYGSVLTFNKYGGSVAEDTFFYESLVPGLVSGYQGSQLARS